MVAEKITQKQHVPHVLLIDGNEAQRQQSFDDLSARGYRVNQAADIRHAIAYLKKGKFDIILLDPVSVGADGFSFLKTIRTHKTLESIPVLILTDSNDPVVEQKCEKYKSHGFQHKPIEVERLHKTIVEILVKLKGLDIKQDGNVGPPLDPATRNNLIKNISAKLQTEEIQLPSAPKLLGKIINMLNDDSASIADIADLIEKEPTVSTRIIKAANSSAFASSKPAKTTHEAAIRLGLKNLMNYVMIINNAQFFTFENPLFKKIREDLWKHSLQVAVCAKYVAQNIGFSQPDSLFTYGLLHDIGKLSLLRVIQELPPDENTSNEEAVLQTLQKFHTHFGSALLENWQFPKEFIMVARCHHDTPIKGVHGKYLIITSYANQVIHKLETNQDETTLSQLLRLPHAPLLKITQNFMKALPEELEKEMAILAHLL